MLYSWLYNYGTISNDYDEIKKVLFERFDGVNTFDRDRKRIPEGDSTRKKRMKGCRGASIGNLKV